MTLALKWGLILGGWVLAGGAGWIALHEYHVAASQASRDQAQYAIAQQQATADALRQQQQIDAQELAKANKMRQQAEDAARIATQTTAAALAHAAASQQAVRTIIRQEGPTACASQPIPPAILSQLTH